MISESRIKRAAKNHDFGFETFFALLLEPSELRVKNRPPPEFGWNRSKTLSFTRGHTLITLISLINVEGVQNLPNVEGRILWKKLMHNSNKRGVEGGKNLRNQ